MPQTRPTIDDYVRVGIAAARVRAGRIEIIEDDLGPEGFANFRSKEEAALKQFSAIRKAIENLNAMREPNGIADPVVTAACRLFVVNKGGDAGEHVDHVMALHNRVLELPVDKALLPRRGRPARDPIVEAAARAAMHWLSEQGLQYWCDWRYVEDRNPGRGGKRSTEDELLAFNDAAKAVLSAIKRSGISFELSEVKSSTNDYTMMLNENGGRKPVKSDYVEDFYVDAD